MVAFALVKPGGQAVVDRGRQSCTDDRAHEWGLTWRRHLFEQRAWRHPGRSNPDAATVKSGGQIAPKPGGAGYGNARLPREDHVLFCPGVGALTMRAGPLVLFQLRVAPGIFFDGLASYDQSCGGGAAD